MRLLKLKTPLLALILAIIAFALLQAISMAVGSALSPQTRVNMFDRAWRFFYLPADTLAFLCLPGSFFHEGLQPVAVMEAVYGLCALLQWYLIFLAGIGLLRHHHKTRT